MWWFLLCDVFLDVKFEEDDHVLPLMSAVDIWENLRSTVAEDSLFEIIGNLLSVQVNSYHLTVQWQFTSAIKSYT